MALRAVLLALACELASVAAQTSYGGSTSYGGYPPPPPPPTTPLYPRNNIAPKVIAPTGTTTQGSSAAVLVVLILLAIAVSVWANAYKAALCKPEFTWGEVCPGGGSAPAAGATSSSDVEVATSAAVAAAAASGGSATVTVTKTGESPSGDAIHLRHVLRPIGILMVLIGIVELGVGFSCYEFWQTFPKVGGWWVSVLALPAAGSALWAKNRSAVIAACVLGSFNIVVSMAAAITDGIASAVWNTNNNVVCGQAQQDGSYIIYGSTSAAGTALITESLASWGYAVDSDTSDCECIIANGNIPIIYTLNSPSSTTCADVQNTWMPNLSASAALCSLCCILSFISI